MFINKKNQLTQKPFKIIVWIKNNHQFQYSRLIAKLGIEKDWMKDKIYTSSILKMNYEFQRITMTMHNQRNSKTPFQLEPYKWKSQNLIDPFNKNMRNSISKHQTKSRDYKMNEITKYLKLWIIKLLVEHKTWGCLQSSTSMTSI